jgi:urease accessory protein
MSWHAQLNLDYAVQANRTVVRHQHTGPLRILQSLYPEGDAICHNVLVHPPGGLVGGDTLEIQVTARGNAHGLVTTPGATRFYKSSGEAALQRTHIQLQDKARLEWLPLEALCYNGCLAENRLTIDLAPQAEFIGWDVTAFGLPLANQPFERGSLRQHIEVPGLWLERGLLDASDARLMQGSLGLAGHCCMASIFFISGTKLDRVRRELALDTARNLMAPHSLNATAGATAPNDRMVVVRVLAPVVEPALQLLKSVWAAWREVLWMKSASSPRIWSM